TSVTRVKNEFSHALRRRRFEVDIIQDGPTFCRMVVRRGSESTLVDLAIDSPPQSTPVITVLGPTLPPLELAGRKLLALFGRAEARDFAEVYVLAQRFGKDVLVERARMLDAGFDTEVLSEMIATLGRFGDHELPLDGSEIPRLRSFFAAWGN